MTDKDPKSVEAFDRVVKKIDGLSQGPKLETTKTKVPIHHVIVPKIQSIGLGAAQWTLNVLTVANTVAAFNLAVTPYNPEQAPIRQPVTETDNILITGQKEFDFRVREIGHIWDSQKNVAHAGLHCASAFAISIASVRLSSYRKNRENGKKNAPKP
jgi:hypothetical protein